MAGDFDASRQWLRRAYLLAKEAGQRRCQAWAFAEIAEVDRIRGFRRRALEAHLEVMEEFNAFRDIKGITWAQLGAGQI